MSEDGTLTGSLALTASQYQSRTTVVTVTTAGPFRVLTANGSRWAVLFSPGGGAGNTPMAYPGPPVATMPQNVTIPGVMVYKFPDGPSWVTGEWFCNTNLPPITITVVECIYLR